MLSGLNVTDISCGMTVSGANGINGVGGCPSVTHSTKNRTWTDTVVTLVTRGEKPATD